MTTTTDPITTTAADLTVGGVNARGENTFLWGPGYDLTARELTYCLAAHIARFGDTLCIGQVDPLCAIDAHMRHQFPAIPW
jgi:hypothetical protein